MVQSDQAQSAGLEESGEQLRVVRLPTQLAGLEVIVPYALIAEITEVMLPESGTQLGRQEAALVDWRGQRIPLVSLEAMMSEPLPTIGQRVRCAVLYGTNGDIALPYFAVLLSGVPRSEQVNPERFEHEAPGDGLLWRVSASLDGRRVVVPDIRELENRIVEMKLRAELDDTATET